MSDNGQAGTTLTEPERREHVAEILERSIGLPSAEHDQLILLAISALRCREIRRME